MWVSVLGQAGCVGGILAQAGGGGVLGRAGHSGEGFVKEGQARAEDC